MKLISLKLLHYRRFRQQEIIFQDDFSLIFGKNWAGKSSILDAIWYSLFGPSSKDFVRVNRQYLKSYFLTEREPSKIELTFQYGMENYRIVRIIDAGTKKFASEFITETKDTLFWPHHLEIIWGDEITMYISKLIWVNKDIFLKSVFAQQKDLEVLSWSLFERKDFIHSILWLHKIETIISNFKSEEKEKKITLEVYKKRVTDFDGEQLKMKKEEWSIKWKEVLENLKNLKIEQEDLQKIYKNIKNDFDLINEKKNKYTQLNQDILLKKEQNINISKNLEEKNNILSDIVQKEIFIEENKQLITQEQELKNILLIYQNTKEKFNQKQILEKELNQNMALVQELEKKIKELNKENIKNIEEKNNTEIDKINTEIKQFLWQKSTIESELNQIKKSWEDTKKELENIEKIWKDSPCPTCKRPLLEEYPNLIHLFNKDLLSKREEYKTKNEILTSILSQTKIFEENLEKLKVHQKILEQKEKDVFVFTQKYQNITENISNIKQKLDLLKDINYSIEEHIKVEKEYEEIKTKFLEYNKVLWQVSQKETIINFISFQSKILSQNNELLKDWENKLSHLNFKIEDFENIKKTYDEINFKINEKNNEIHLCSKNKLEIDFEMKNIEKQEKDGKENKQTIDSLVLEIDNISFKKQIISDYMVYLLQYMKPRIEDIAGEYFSLITDYKYSTLSLDDDYNILIDGKNLDLYSGWERDLANLCLRLSLWQNLTTAKWNPIHFLILDEVLSSQDKERQQNIGINLKKLKQKFSQIILISHLEEIKDLATNLIEIKALNREESVIEYH